MSNSFRTEIFPAQLPFSVSHDDSSLWIGSCFSESIGHLMSRYRFPLQMNPHGILFNPESIAIALEDVIAKRKYIESDLHFFNGFFQSWNHHGKFNNASASHTLDQINNSILLAHETLKNASVIFITFGSAWAYTWNHTKQVVANCHKVPNTEFTKLLIEYGIIVKRWSELIQSIQKLNPTVRFVFTVSPVRHWKDGVVENQISKSHLILAINELTKLFGQVHYFPAYEMMLDDLRDYRFYKEDMLHPNDIAVQYIWQKFSNWILSDISKAKVHKLEPILRFLEHKPLHATSENREQLLVVKEREIEAIVHG